MKYRKFDLIIEILLCCFPIVFFCGCFYLALMQAEDDEYKVSTKHSSVVFDFNNLWKMQFPEEFTSTYVFYNRGGWMGEGEFFAVYDCEQPNEEFLSDFSEEYNDEVERWTNGYFDSFPYDSERYEIKLDRSYQPDFSQEFISVSYHSSGSPEYTIYKGEEYWWGNDQSLYMSYFPKNKMLYIYESIT